MMENLSESLTFHTAALNALENDDDDTKKSSSHTNGEAPSMTTYTGSNVGTVVLTEVSLREGNAVADEGQFSYFGPYTSPNFWKRLRLF